MADMKCKPKLFVGSGCTQLKSRSSVHWKILPSMITRNNTWIVAAHSSDEKKEMFEWFAVNSEESAQRQILGETTLFFAGFDVYRSRVHELCFVIRKDALANKFYEYHVPDATSLSLQYYTLEFQCKGKKIEEDALKVHDVASEKSMHFIIIIAHYIERKHSYTKVNFIIIHLSCHKRGLSANRVHQKR